MNPLPALNLVILGSIYLYFHPQCPFPSYIMGGVLILAFSCLGGANFVHLQGGLGGKIANIVRL